MARTTKTAAAETPVEAAIEEAPVEVVAEMDERQRQIVEMGETVKPLIVAAYDATETEALSSADVVSQGILPLMALFPDDNGLPCWNRTNGRISPDYFAAEDAWYMAAIESMPRTEEEIAKNLPVLPAADDYPRAVKREQILANLLRTRNNVRQALIGQTGGKGLLQQAIVDYSFENVDPGLTNEQWRACRSIDAQGKYFNYATLPTHLLAFIQEEYRRCGLKLPANLGGKASTSGSGDTRPGTQVTTTLTNLATVVEASNSGRITIATVTDAMLTLAQASLTRSIDAAKAGWDGIDKNTRDAAALTLKNISDLTYVNGKVLAGIATESDIAKVNHLLPTTEPVTPVDGVTSGAEQDTPTTEVV